MAGKVPVTESELKKALDMLCVADGKQVSEGEDQGKKRYLLSPGDIIVRLEEGRIICDSQAIYEKVAEIVMDLRQSERPREPSAPKQEDRPKGGAIATGKEGKGKDDFSVETWRQRQDRSYNVAGKQAPNAFAASEEANRRGLCTQIMDSGRTKDLVWGQVRVLDPKSGQFREDRVSHERETFMLLKAWEDANSQARYFKDTPLIIGIQENNMPQLDPDLKVKGKPAPLWLTLEVMRSWSFADRDAITKAERRAQLKIMNQEFREQDEIALETEEEKAVQESIDMKRGRSA